MAMMVKANRNVPSDRMVAAVLVWCGASVYRRTGWAGWRMSWEPCPVVLRLPFGERAGLLGDSVFSTLSWFLSLPILFRYRWFPILPLDVAINDQTDRARLVSLTFASSPRFLNKVSYQQSQTDPFSGIPLRSRLMASAIRVQER